MKPQSKTAVLFMVLGLPWGTSANAQLTVLNSNVPAGFAVTGFIQAATLNPGGAANAGGTITINNITMTVPDNSVIQMPAQPLTWAQLFDVKQSAPVFDNAIPAQTPPPINHPANNSLGLPMTGLTLSDAPATPAAAGTFPGFFPSCEVTVIGNIGTTGVTGNPPFIVAMILPVSQEIANAGAGFITSIDYQKGRFEVNGTLNTPNTGTVIEINDPIGRYGLAHSPDPRFRADTDNPTVTSGNGFPMGIPKVAPPAIDPDRPTFNRPLNPAPGVTSPFPHNAFLQVQAPLMAFTMPAAAAAGTTKPDPWKQVPFMVGDFVTFFGSIYKIHPNDPVTPFDPTKPVSATNRPMSQQFYISANTVTDEKLEVITAAGPVAQAGPAYMSLERTKIGTGPAVPPPLVGRVVPAAPGIDGGVVPVVEPKDNINIVGFVTEPTALVDIFAVDVDPASGQEQPRLLQSVLPEVGPPGMGNRGRFRFDVGKAPVLPVTREFLVQTRHGTVPLTKQVGINGSQLAGLESGQYQAPNFDYQIADSPPGFPISASNFNTFPFLAKGEGPNQNIGGATVTIGPLTPFPPSTP